MIVGLRLIGKKMNKIYKVFSFFFFTLGNTYFVSKLFWFETANIFQKHRHVTSSPTLFSFKLSSWVEAM